MKFAVLGSCIGGDVINKAKEQFSDYNICANFVSYNPLALTLGVDNNIVLNDSLFSSESEGEKIRIKNDYLGNVLDQVVKFKPDYLLVDLSDLRIPVNKITFKNGKTIYVTERNLKSETEKKINLFLEQKVGAKITDIYKLNYNNIDLNEVIDSFIKILKTKFEGKLIFFKPKLVNQYIDGNNIKHTPNFRISTNLNKKFDEIYKILEQKEVFIDCPKNIIGDASCLSPFEYHASKPYYDYMVKTINSFIKNKKHDQKFLYDSLQECEKELHNLYNGVFCRQILLKIKNYLNKKIVLIAKTRLFEQMLKKRI